MILNTRQQAELFAVANGQPTNSGIDYNLLGATMADAVASQPAPVLDYAEFTTFQNNVTRYNEQANL
jgi:hypothetical protein